MNRASMSMRKAGASLALAVLPWLAACDGGAKPEETVQATTEGETVIFAAGSPQLKALRADPAVERPAPGHPVNGRLAWNEEKTVRVYTPFAGRVEKILVQPGDAVRAGQTLALVGSPDFGQAQAEARSADSALQLAEKNLARVRELSAAGVSPGKDLNAAEADFSRAQAEASRARARIRLYGGGGAVDQQFSLASPIAGIVVERNINPGQEVRPDAMTANAPALFVITDPRHLWVLLEAPEQDLGRFKVGREIRLRVPAYPDESFKARVTAVADFLDPQTRTLKVRAELANPDRWLKGEMFVAADVSNEADVYLQVPQRAVFFQGAKHFVFVEDAPGRYTRREVRTGDAYDGRVIVFEGLKPGDKVVSEGALFLQQVLQPRRVKNK